jgi:spore maturation protein CgeB
VNILLADTTLYGNPLFADAVGPSGVFVDDARFLRPLERSLLHKVAYRVCGRRPLTQGAYNRWLRTMVTIAKPDLVLVVKGAYITPDTLRFIKSQGAVLVNYATDDPFNEKTNTPDLLEGMPLYDLYACTKRAIMGDIPTRTAFVPFAYNPAKHFPEKSDIQTDVVVVGGADEDRVPYVEAVAKTGCGLSLYGGYWERFPHLKQYACGFVRDERYRAVLGGAKIVLCFVRKANRDGHAMRSFETPACGAFMLAERTAEHQEFFEEGHEAEFFESPDELAEKVTYFRFHNIRRKYIARNGYEKVTEGHHTYADRLEEIVRLVS